MKFCKWGTKIEQKLYLTDADLKELCESGLIEYRPNDPDWMYLPTIELLHELQDQKIVPKYVKSYSMKIDVAGYSSILSVFYDKK